MLFDVRSVFSTDDLVEVLITAHVHSMFVLSFPIVLSVIVWNTESDQ